MSLSDSDRQDAARRWIAQFFVEPNATANLSHTDIAAAVAAIDADLDAQVSTLGISGTATMLAALVGLLPEPFKSGSSAAQKAAVYSYVFLKRAGVI